jgi:hypothetical protein
MKPIKEIMQQRDAEVDRLLSCLSSVDPMLAFVTVTKDMAQALLLKTEAQMILNGRLYEIRAKSLGAGVYRLYLKYERVAERKDL